MFVLFDLESLLGMPRTTAFVNGQDISGRDGSLDVGDFQVYSNIDAPSGTQLSEAWLESWPVADVLRVKLGKIDANSDFARIDSAADFIQSSAGYTPTIVAFPTYPDPAFGVVAGIDDGALGLTLGVFDGALGEGIATGRLGPKNFFTDDEASSHMLLGELGRAGDGWRLAFGAWHHSADFARFDGGTDDGTSGGWVVGEIEVLAADPERGELRSIALFASAGLADADVSAAAAHVVAGAVMRAPFGRRPRDSLGALVSWVDLSDAPGSGFPRDETECEVYYRVGATRFLALQPGLVVAVDPGGRSDVRDAVIGTLRVVLEF